MAAFRSFLLILSGAIFPLFASAIAPAFSVFKMDSSLQSSVLESRMDSLVQRTLENKPVVYSIAHAVPSHAKTMDFYLVLGVLILLGLIRLTDPRYFQELWHSFRNPASGSRQAREKMQQASFTNLLMNFFFAISAGFYLYYAVGKYFLRSSFEVVPDYLLLMMIGGILGIYLTKYLVVRFIGWAFNLEGITDHYLFNVLLINKVLALVFVPFIILLAFAGRGWAEPALIISMILVAGLLINRYIRSWKVFGSFFQFSKFHFFTYLCASEILPLAILLKLLVRGLLL